MKIRIYLILFFLKFFCNIDAQNCFTEYEKYNCYEQHIYMDCLDQKLVPEIFNSIYYAKIKESEFYIDTQIIDTVHQKRIIHAYTKKAQNGYLFVNKMIMDKVDALNLDINKSRMVYIHNNKIVSTSNGVKRIVGLKVKNIQNTVILQNEKSNSISVYIYDD